MHWMLSRNIDRTHDLFLNDHIFAYDVSQEEAHDIILQHGQYEYTLIELDGYPARVTI